jgi:hypothetical protein
MSTYAYWLKHPQGWDYPAACASGIAGKGGWAASVDLQRGMCVSLNTFNEIEAASQIGGKCAGCTSGCTVEWGD